MVQSLIKENNRRQEEKIKCIDSENSKLYIRTKAYGII